MLPFTKRPQRRSEPVDTLTTGDLEVVHATANTLKRASAAPPPVFERSLPDVVEEEEDNDRTLLMSSKTKSTPPAPRVAPEPATGVRKPVAPPSLRGLVRRRLDTEDHTLLRPQAQMAIEAAPRKAKAAARTPAMMPTPYMAIKPQPVPASAPAAARVNAKGGSDAKPAKSDAAADAKLDVPAAVITQRTRVIPPKRSWSWGAALVAVGIAAGLAVAIVARGDADAILDATARLVDPSGAHAPAAAAAAVQAPIAPIAAAPAAIAPVAATPACATDTAHPFSSTPVMTPPVAIAPPPKMPDLSVAKPEPPRPAPVAWAAPGRASAPQPAAPPRAVAPPPAPAPPAPKPVAVAAAKPAAPAAKGAAAPKGNEMDNASAADALAKAQLEASLR